MLHLRLAGIALAVSASLFLFAAPSFGAVNNIIAFGDIDSSFNPANLNPRIPRAEISAYNIVDNSAIPAISFYSDFDGPTFRGDRGFAKKVGNYGLYVSSGNFGFGYELTDATDYSGSGDGIRLLQDMNKNRHVPGTVYNDVRISGTDQSIENVKFYYSRDLDLDRIKALRIGLCFKFIKGTYYQNAGIVGNAVQVDGSTTNFKFDLDGHFSTEKTAGNGYGIDLGGNCQVNDRLSLTMMLENVAGEMLWENLRRMTATGDSQNITVDPSGTVISNPTISGYKFKESLLTRPLFKSIWGARYAYAEGLSLISILEPYTDVTYYWAGAEWQPNSGLKVRTGYGSEYDAVSFAIDWGILNLQLSANNVSLSEARSLGLLLGIHF